MPKKAAKPKRPDKTAKNTAPKKSEKKADKKSAKQAEKKPEKKVEKKAEVTAEKPGPKAPPAKAPPAEKAKPVKAEGEAAKKPSKGDAKPVPGKSAAPAKQPSPEAKPAKADAAPPSQGEEAQTDAAKAAEAAKTARKGITIVTPKPHRRPKAPVSTVSAIPAGLGRLLDPKNPIRKPLIASGPKAAPQRPLGQHGGAAADQPRPAAKSPFGKRELDHFRQTLIRKRAELVGDVSTMETQALRGQSGSLSNMPQHMAEQGSEAYDQSLSLDLAAADRKLIREIDDALGRIADGTFGICELTGKPIKTERLEELPWARHSIEAARELERQSMRL